MSEKSKVNEQIVKVVYDLVVAIIDKVVPLPDDGYSLKDDCDINIKNTEEYVVSHNGKKLEKNHDYKVSISAEFIYVLATDEEIATDEYAIYMEEYDKEGRTRQENEKRAEETGEDITNIVYTKRILKKIATFEFTGLNNYYGKSVIKYATVVTKNEFNLYRQRFEK